MATMSVIRVRAAQPWYIIWPGKGRAGHTMRAAAFIILSVASVMLNAAGPPGSQKLGAQPAVAASTALTTAASEPIRIIIDTDPGTDDAMAILLALNSPEVKMEALTVVP